MAKKILTVDDSISMRQMISFTLRENGYEVVEAIDGQDGISKAQDQSFDLIFTDQNMPNIDGITLIQMLRDLPQHEKTPILMLTTEASDEMKKLGRAAGATGWLVKPFDPEKLLAVVKKVLG
jgi:two-component system, chemotaxis family, chemotaxis protein CheY